MTAVASPNPKAVPYTFSQLVRGREDKFPVLARAVVESTPARNLTIEWTVDCRQEYLMVFKNYCQIVRFPYSDAAAEGAVMMGTPSPDLKDEQLEDFLSYVEKILVNGVPAISPSRIRRWCGGYRFYLGRELNDNDIIRLRPLREPVWRVVTHTGLDREDGPFEMAHPVAEWLAEFSLQVIPQAA